MTRFFLSIYDYFSTRRSLLFSLTMLVVALLTLLATKVKFDENITDIFPKTQAGENMSMVFKNLKSKDRILVLFSARGEETTQEDLIEACDDFAFQLTESPVKKDIRRLTTTVGSNEISRTTEFIYDYLPVFLTEEDYSRIDSLLDKDALREVMRCNYQRMLSPVGIGLSNFIARDPLGIAGETLGELQNFNPSLSYCLSEDHIFSADKSTCILILESVHAGSDTVGNDALVEMLDTLVERNNSDKIEVAYFGTPAIAVYNARQIKSDMYITMSVALLLIVLAISRTFRKRWSVLLITLPVCFGGLFALGVIALTTGHISLIAVGAGAAVFGIAFSYSTHVVCHSNHTTNLRDIVEELAYPMVVGSFTTIGAFVGLMFTSSPLLCDFGLFAALALIGTTLFSLICLPHLLGGDEEEKSGRLLDYIERFNTYPFERNKWLVGAILLLFLWGVFTCNRVGFDNDMSHLSYIPPRMAQTESRLEELFGINAHSVTVLSASENPEKSIEVYTRLCDSLRGKLSDGEIGGMISAERFIVAPSVQEEKIRRWDNFWKENNRRERLLKGVAEAGAEAGFSAKAFYEFEQMLYAPFSPIDYNEEKIPATPLLEAWISSTDRATLVLAQIDIAEENKEKVYSALDSIPGVITVDRGYFANKMAKTVNDDFNYVLYMSGLLVFFALMASYRRWELTLMTFLPMFIAFTIILGLMFLFGFEFNIVNIILSTFIFGIGDDFSIFIMDGLQREYSNGRKMLANHKTAIFFSVLTTIIGIGALIFAHHPVLRSTSVISIIGMVAVILSSYTILPLVFRWAVTRPVVHGNMPYTLGSCLRTLYSFFIFIVMCTVAQIVIPTLVFSPLSGKCRRRWLHYVTYYSCRSLLWMISPSEKKILANFDARVFDKPSIIIANHHSFVDILLLLSLSPKVVMVTNSWVWKSPVFGRIIRYLGFCCTDLGYEDMQSVVEQNFKEGYSVVIFPEGTRSKDGRTMGRFHKGAFYLAEQLGADILPILIYGTGMICPKRQPFSIQRGYYGAKLLPRIAFADTRFGEGYRARTKAVSRYFKQEYEAWCAELDTVRNLYFRESIIKNYIFKMNGAEQKARRRFRHAHNFASLTEGLPREGTVVVLGAGQGELALLIALLSSRRRVVAYGSDADALQIARHGCAYISGVEFFETDYHMTELPEADCYIFSSETSDEVRQRLAPLCKGEIRYE